MLLATRDGREEEQLPCMQIVEEAQSLRHGVARHHHVWPVLCWGHFVVEMDALTAG